MRNVPLYYHPTTVVIIDDSERYIEEFKIKFANFNFNILSFKNSQEALKYINSKLGEIFPSSDYFSYKEVLRNDYEEWSIGLKLYEIPKKIFNENRYFLVSTVICDYSMPGMNGVEFFKNINNPFISKILLTGIADENVAVENFNNGLINSYVKKEGSKGDAFLEKMIKKSIYEYFAKISITGTDVIVSNVNKNSLLIDPNFFDFFSSILSEYDIREYYIFESFGCYILIDNNDDIYIFFAYTKKDAVDILYSIYQDDLRSEKEFNLNPRIMGYFSFEEPEFPLENELEKYLLDAKLFKGRYNDFYWSIKKFDIGKFKNKYSNFKKFII